MNHAVGQSFPPLVAAGPELTPEQLTRYGRHLTLPGIGVEGQRRLRGASVLVVGAGGLGSPVLLYLAAAGVGHITIIDDDVVEESNLQRQVIHRVRDVSRPKVDSARDAVARIDPSIQVTTYRKRLTADNALGIIDGHHLVLDGSDNFETRYLVGDACEILQIPCVWGAVLRFAGQVSVFWAGRGPVYRDIFPQPPDPSSVPSCAQAGVFGVLCAAIGAAMGTEAIKLITGVGQPLVGRLLLHDALVATWRELAVRPDPSRAPVTALTRPVPAVCAVDVAAVEPTQLAARVTQGALLVDVREPEEADVVTIDGAELHPLGQILSGSGILPKDRELILYCRSGVRSHRAATHLLAQGYSQVSQLRGGILEWISQVRPDLPKY